MIAWQLPTLARGDPLTTIGVTKLNFCVRNGNRCDLYAIITTLSGRRDSNPRPPPWQGGVLPLNYFRKNAWQLPTLARGDPLTTIGVTKLNFCVRNGNRCSLCAIATTLFCENLVLSKLDNIFISENATFLTWLSPRPISNGPLHTSPYFHFHPIYLIISQGSYFHKGMGNLISR